MSAWIRWLISQPRTSQKNPRNIHVQTCITDTHERTHPHRNSRFLPLMLLAALFLPAREFSSSVTDWSAVAVACVRATVSDQPWLSRLVNVSECQVRSQGPSLHSTAHLSVAGTAQEALCMLGIQSCWLWLCVYLWSAFVCVWKGKHVMHVSFCSRECRGRGEKDNASLLCMRYCHRPNTISLRATPPVPMIHDPWLPYGLKRTCHLKDICAGTYICVTSNTSTTHHEASALLNFWI